MDVFDYLDIIKSQRENGLTQEQIGQKLGWSQDKVKNHSIIIEHVGTQNLELAKSHQEGRVPDNGTNVPIDFTEGWFRELLKVQKVYIPETKSIIDMGLYSGDYGCSLNPEGCTRGGELGILFILLAVVLFLIVPYLYVRFIELRFVSLVRKIKLKLYFNFVGILQRVRPH